ncbi:MAG TPA: hypothetical protein VGH49_08270 [Xanthobacteraceae bacterium]
MASATARDARHHTEKMRQRLTETMDHLRRDVDVVDEPRLKAMFETSAEVLGGLVKAFRDYEQKSESAWR